MGHLPCGQPFNNGVYFLGIDFLLGNVVFEEGAHERLDLSNRLPGNIGCHNGLIINFIDGFFFQHFEHTGCRYITQLRIDRPQRNL